MPPPPTTTSLPARHLPPPRAAPFDPRPVLQTHVLDVLAAAARELAPGDATPDAAAANADVNSPAPRLLCRSISKALGVYEQIVRDTQVPLTPAQRAACCTLFLDLGLCRTLPVALCTGFLRNAHRLLLRKRYPGPFTGAADLPADFVVAWRPMWRRFDEIHNLTAPSTSSSAHR